MLVGTFVYVMGDGLVSSTLLAHNFTRYPLDCREKRQEAKAWIIPIAAILVTLGFTCSVTLLGIHRAGGALDVIKGSALSGMLVPLAIFFSVCSVDELGTIAGMVNDFCEHLGDGS